MIKDGLLLIVATVGMASCSAEKVNKVNKAGETENSITVSFSEEKAAEVDRSRWHIEVFNGPSITGDPATNHIFLTNADTRLIEIVDQCRLGKTYRMQHTDGVLMLAIANSDLAAEQLECVRSKERPGLKLIDRKPQK